MHRGLLVVAAFAGLLAGCSPDPAQPEVLRVHLDEQPVLLGRVIETIDSPQTGDVYLRLER